MPPTYSRCHVDVQLCFNGLISAAEEKERGCTSTPVLPHTC